MTDKEYEQKKQECWEEFRTLDRKSPYSLREVNAFAFDRGYALGKQEKDAEETLTIKKSSDKLKVGDIAINTYANLTDVYIAGIEETSYGIVYTTAYYSNKRIYIERYHENYLIKK